MQITHNTKLCLILPRQRFKEELSAGMPNESHLFPQTARPVSLLYRFSVEKMLLAICIAISFSQSLATHGSSASSPATASYRFLVICPSILMNQIA
jgi:hypothetical protein